MRILLLNQFYRPDPAATGQLLADVAAHLVARGHEVHVVCSRRAYAGGPQRLPHEERLDGVNVHRVGATGFGRGGFVGRVCDYLSFYVLALRCVRKLLPPDVCLALTTPPFIGLVGARLARRSGTKLILWSMDLYPEIAVELGVFRRGGLLYRLLARLARGLYRRCAGVVALSEPMRERLLAIGVSAEQIVVIPNWVPGEAVSPQSADASALRRREGLSGKTIVLYSGNIGLAHEFDTLIAAARSLAARDDVALLFVGGGKRLPELRAAAGEFGSLFRFVPAQPLEGLSDALAAGAVHLITMRESVNGLIAPSKVYGALAAGRPLVFVGPEQNEVARLIREADVGCVVRPGEAERLTRCLETLIDDPEGRVESGRRAREVYESRFGRERSCEEFAGLIERIDKDG